MNWWQTFAYLGAVMAVLARAKALYPGRAVRTLVVIEDPARPLTVEEATARLSSTGAVIVPGFRVTP